MSVCACVFFNLGQHVSRVRGRCGLTCTKHGLHWTRGAEKRERVKREGERTKETDAGG